MIDIILTSNITLLALLLAITVLICMCKNLIVSSILLSIFSLLMAAIYLFLGAPDVAITEAAVGAGISTIFIICALTNIKQFEVKSSTNNKFLLLGIVVITFVMLLYGIINMPEFGRINNPAHNYITTYYIKQTIQNMGFTNVVSAVLASFRGYDTLGETVVVFTAAIAVTMLLQKEDKNEK